MKFLDISMLAAETPRSIFYIKKMISKNLLPNYVILLLNKKNKNLPGQKKNYGKQQITNLLKSSKIKFKEIYNTNINSDEVVEVIKSRSEKVFIFSGFGGSILKKKILATGKKFLHIHGGYLPDYKGSTTNYYSLIEENKIGASAIFLEKDIDSGPILLRRKFIAPKNKQDIDYTLDSEVRAKLLVECLQNYKFTKRWYYKNQKNNDGETFYIIHPVLKHIAILK